MIDINTKSYIHFKNRLPGLVIGFVLSDFGKFFFLNVGIFNLTCEIIFLFLIFKDFLFDLSIRQAKPIIFAFFDNIIVNDNDEIIRKNRLELLQMFCRTFENYINFSKIEST